MKSKIFCVLIGLLAGTLAMADINKRQEIFPADRGSRNSGTLNTVLGQIKSTDNATVVLSGGAWTITNNVTVPTNVNLKVVYGSSFAVDNGSTVTLANVKLDAGPYQIFSGAGNATGNADFIYRWPQWGNTNRFDIGDGALDATTVLGIITNESYTMADGTTVTFDKIVVQDTATFNSNLVFGTAAASNSIIDLINYWDGTNAQVSTFNTITVTNWGSFGTVTSDVLNVNGIAMTPQTNETVTITNGSSRATIESQIAGTDKYIPSGQTLTFQFEDGNYALDQSISIAGYYGGGSMEIFGNTGENELALHTNQAVTLSFTDASGLAITRCAVKVTMNNIHIWATNSTDYAAIDVGDVSEFIAQGCFFQCADASGTSHAAKMNKCNAYLDATYYAGADNGLSSFGARVYSKNSTNIVLQPAYGLLATDSGTIGKGGFQPTGSSANESTTLGGVIR